MIPNEIPISHLREILNRFDADKNGKLDKTEQDNLIGQLGNPNNRVDKKGSKEDCEFATAMLLKDTASDIDGLVDGSKDGAVDMAELTKLARLGGNILDRNKIDARDVAVLTSPLNRGTGAAGAQAPAEAPESSTGSATSQPNSPTPANGSQSGNTAAPADPQAAAGVAQVYMQSRNQRTQASGSVVEDIKKGLAEGEYVVKSGDTLSEIAKALKEKHSLNNSVAEILDALAVANGIENRDLIRVGQKLDLKKTREKLDAASSEGSTAGSTEETSGTTGDAPTTGESNNEPGESRTEGSSGVDRQGAYSPKFLGWLKENYPRFSNDKGLLETPNRAKGLSQDEFQQAVEKYNAEAGGQNGSIDLEQALRQYQTLKSEQDHFGVDQNVEMEDIGAALNRDDVINNSAPDKKDDQEAEKKVAAKGIFTPKFLDFLNHNFRGYADKDGHVLTNGDTISPSELEEALYDYNRQYGSQEGYIDAEQAGKQFYTLVDEYDNPWAPDMNISIEDIQASINKARRAS